MNQAWNMGDGRDCIFCLVGRGTMVFKVTKKGGAMIYSKCCGTRCFIQGDGTRGPELIFGAMTMALKDGKPEVAETIHQIAVQKETANESASTG